MIRSQRVGGAKKFGKLQVIAYAHCWKYQFQWRRKYREDTAVYSFRWKVWVAKGSLVVNFQSCSHQKLRSLNRIFFLGHVLKLSRILPL